MGGVRASLAMEDASLAYRKASTQILPTEIRMKMRPSLLCYFGIPAKAHHRPMAFQEVLILQDNRHSEDFEPENIPRSFFLNIGIQEHGSNPIKRKRENFKI